MNTKILKLLGITKERYEFLIFCEFHRWCEARSITENDFQKLIANNQIFNWWHSMYMCLELVYLSDMAGYEDLTDRSTAVEFYKETVRKVDSYYPKKLLNKARKLKIIN